MSCNVAFGNVTLCDGRWCGVMRWYVTSCAVVYCTVVNPYISWCITLQCNALSCSVINVCVHVCILVCVCVCADSHICINSTYFYIYMDTNYIPPTIRMYMHVKMPIKQATVYHQMLGIVWLKESTTISDRFWFCFFDCLLEECMGGSKNASFWDAILWQLFKRGMVFEQMLFLCCCWISHEAGGKLSWSLSLFVWNCCSHLSSRGHKKIFVGSARRDSAYGHPFEKKRSCGIVERLFRAAEQVWSCAFLQLFATLCVCGGCMGASFCICGWGASKRGAVRGVILKRVGGIRLRNLRSFSGGGCVGASLCICGWGTVRGWF